MDIRLESLQLSNFKGIRSMQLDANNQNIKAYADNCRGKTTLYDAFLWGLFDKDSAGRSGFEIKPLGADGQPVHLLETWVAIGLRIDGQTVLLKKMFKEKWIKKRGDAESTFSGHETLYWVNDVPVKSVEYKAKISNWIDEITFRRITSPEYFVSQKVPEMRRALIEMCGNVSDFTVAGSDRQLMSLVQLMQDRNYTPEDLAKVTRQNIQQYNKEMATIPARIDEVRRTAPMALDWPTLESERSAVANELNDMERKLQSARRVSKDVSLKQELLYKLRDEYESIKHSLLRDIREQANLWQESEMAKRRELKQANEDLLSLIEKEVSDSALLKSLKISIDEKRAEHSATMLEQNKIRAEVWLGLDPEESVCGRCGQTLPADQLEKLTQVAQERFEKRIKSALGKLVERANSIVGEGKNLKQKIGSLTESIQHVQQEIVAKRNIIALMTADLESFEMTKPGDIKLEDIDQHPLLVNLRAQINEIEQSLQPCNEQAKAFSAQHAELSEKLRELERQLGVRERIDQTEQRVKELTDRNRHLGDLIAEQEGVRYAIERFIRRKAEMLEQSINSRFQYVQFRLFKQNLNGGIEDDCEPLINGVPYSTNASTSERIRAGLDIVRTMQQASNITAPVFVDNAESATWLLPMNCQMIQLIVSKEDQTLRFEREA